MAAFLSPPRNFKVSHTSGRDVERCTEYKYALSFVISKSRTILDETLGVVVRITPSTNMFQVFQFQSCADYSLLRFVYEGLCAAVHIRPSGQICIKFCSWDGLFLPFHNHWIWIQHHSDGRHCPNLEEAQWQWARQSWSEWFLNTAAGNLEQGHWAILEWMVSHIPQSRHREKNIMDNCQPPWEEHHGPRVADGSL